MERYLHRSNPSRRTGCSSISDMPELRNYSSNDEHDTSKIADAIPSEKKNATMPRVIELPDAARLTRNVSSFDDSACADNRCSPREENNCSICNCNRMDQRNQDATRESEARRHSISSRAREGFSDHVHRVFSVLRTNYLASSGWRPYLLLICLSCMLLPATSRDCAIGLRTPGCKFRFSSQAANDCFYLKAILFWGPILR